MPFEQYPVPFGSLLLSTPLPPKTLIRAAERAVWSVDPDQGIYRSFAPAEERDAQLAAPKGTLSHRAVGLVWVTLMATTALSSFIFV